MRLVLGILFLIFFSSSEAQIINASSPYRGVAAAGGSYPDTVAKFNFSYTANSVSGFVNLAGDPNTSTGGAIRSGTAASGITCSSVSGTDATWQDNGTAAAGSFDETVANGAFPVNVSKQFFFHQSTTYPTGGNIRLSNMVVGATYEIHVLSNRGEVTDNRLSKIACIDNGGTESITDINTSPSSTSVTSTRSQITSGGTVYFFKNKVPNGSGEISFQVAAASGWTYGYINGIIVIRTA